MSLLIGFALTAGVAIGLLVATILAGRAARRRLHVRLVVLLVLSLVGAVVLAELLGTRYDLQAAGWITPVHLAIAHGTVIVLLVQVATGVLTARRPSLRRWHARCALLTVTLAVLAAVTGALMLWGATPL